MSERSITFMFVALLISLWTIMLMVYRIDRPVTYVQDAPRVVVCTLTAPGGKMQCRQVKYP